MRVAVKRRPIGQKRWRRSWRPVIMEQYLGSPIQRRASSTIAAP
jgi:hypothetical protein